MKINSNFSQVRIKEHYEKHIWKYSWNVFQRVSLRGSAPRLPAAPVTLDLSFSDVGDADLRALAQLQDRRSQRTLALTVDLRGGQGAPRRPPSVMWIFD